MSGPELPVRTDTPSGRLVATLALAGALAGLLIVSVHVWTNPRILEHRAIALRAAVQEVLGDPARTETLYMIDGALTPALPEGTDSLSVERIFVGFDEADRQMGIAIGGAEPGFQDIINLLFGYDPYGKRLLGMKVLDNKETPGLGDKIVKDSTFVGAFVGLSVPITGVKIGSGRGTPGEVDLITGATISSRAVIAIINHQLEAMSPMLDGYFGRSAPAQESTSVGGGGS